MSNRLQLQNFVNVKTFHTQLLPKPLKKSKTNVPWIKTHFLHGIKQFLSNVQGATHREIEKFRKHYQHQNKEYAE